MDLKKQNVLLLVKTMHIGGAEKVVLQLCEILKNRVNKIVVCSSGGVCVSQLDKLKIMHYEIPDFCGENLVKMFRTLRSLKKIIRDEKITVIHSHHRKAAFYAEIMAPGKCMIKIADVHNTFHDKKQLTRFSYRHTRLIAVGEMVKKNLMDYFGISEKRIEVIHNAVKPFVGKIEPVKELVEARKKDNVLIGNIGRLSEQKGIPYFIEAAEIVNKTHPEARYYIIGEGEDREQLEKQVYEKDLENMVIFLGYRDDIQNIIAQLDFIVLCSLWEGFPLTPIETYSVGKTVIGTAVDGTVEIIRDGVDGFLVEARNPEVIAEKIIYLITHPEIRKQMENEARKRYEEVFSFEKLVDSYIRYYEYL